MKWNMASLTLNMKNWDMLVCFSRRSCFRRKFSAFKVLPCIGSTCFQTSVTGKLRGHIRANYLPWTSVFGPLSRAGDDALYSHIITKREYHTSTQDQNSRQKTGAIQVHLNRKSFSKLRTRVEMVSFWFISWNVGQQLQLTCTSKRSPNW